MSSPSPLAHSSDSPKTARRDVGSAAVEASTSVSNDDVIAERPDPELPWDLEEETSRDEVALNPN